MRDLVRAIVVSLVVLLAGCDQNPTVFHGYEIYVMPNPATYEALREFAIRYPDAADPTGLRIAFYGLPPTPVRITIYNQACERVRVLDVDLTASRPDITWNLRDEFGREVPPGFYSYTVYWGADSTFSARGTFYLSSAPTA